MLRDLVHLINVFGLLSLTAVGGGMVTLPQMEHECVQKFHWLTPEQFASAYSLGQLAPGSNMGMVSLIGLHAAGLAGFVLAALAFYLPSSIVVYLAGELWDKFAEHPAREVIRLSLEPVSVGFMLAAVWILGKTACWHSDRALEVNLMTLAIAAGVAIALLRTRINPALLIVASGVAGWLFLR